ncbi:MAG: creatininase family protein [Rhizobiaceae bacterium]
MRLDQATWQEVEARIAETPGIILPAGSTEQHGPMGLIGTDSICAEKIAGDAAELAGCLVAPTLAYAPAPFNMAFAGTVSVSAELFASLFAEIVASLRTHGFALVYVLNGHGANLDPLKAAAANIEGIQIHIRSWWDFEPVNALRQQLYGDWEGMHATPSEIAITQATHRVVAPGDAAQPPEKLSPDFIAAHAGDRHGPPDEHRRQFPDGRVGSHSALARPEHGKAILDAAAKAVADDFSAALQISGSG